MQLIYSFFYDLPQIGEFAIRVWIRFSQNLYDVNMFVCKKVSYNIEIGQRQIFPLIFMFFCFMFLIMLNLKALQILFNGIDITPLNLKFAVSTMCK